MKIDKSGRNFYQRLIPLALRIKLFKLYFIVLNDSINLNGASSDLTHFSSDMTFWARYGMIACRRATWYRIKVTESTTIVISTSSQFQKTQISQISVAQMLQVLWKIRCFFSVVISFLELVSDSIFRFKRYVKEMHEVGKSSEEVYRIT